jgi:RNAse (barnase) inhibitor barstar
MSKEKYTIDFTNVNHYLEMHAVIWHALEFPDYYGCNWDAFWDLLWSDCDADRLVITGEYSMPKEFDGELAVMHEVLERLIQWRKDMKFHEFSYEIRS